MHRASVLVIVGLMTLGVSSRCHAEPPEWWRGPGHDIINCAYLHCAGNGATVSYEQVAGAWEALDKEPSMQSLSRLVDDLGVPSEVAELTYGELISLRFPVVVHVSESIDTGGFHLVTSASSESVTLINGQSGGWRVMSANEFRRVWTGFILRPKPARPVGPWLGSLSVVGGAVTAALGCSFVSMFRTEHRRRG